MIYSNDTTSKNVIRAQAYAANPPKPVQFTPVPFVLLQVASVRGDAEQVALKGLKCSVDYGNYAGMVFDDWHKGDLCIVEAHSSFHTADMKRHETSTFYVAKRASVPSAVRHKFDVGGSRAVTTSDNMTLYRIPYRYLSRAAMLFASGTFETRVELEAALQLPVQSFAIAAE